MPKKERHPTGMRARRNRDGTSTFYMVRPGGEKLVLGKDRHIACSRWVAEQHAQARMVMPTTALGLLSAFVKCSLPLSSAYASARRTRELTILREFFSECGDPPLVAIRAEDEFLTWYKLGKRTTCVDLAVRMFRLVWKFGLELEITRDNCPWKSFDLSKARLQLEAVDVVYGFASAPLKDLLGELLAKASTTTVEQGLYPVEPNRLQRLQAQLKQAASSAVAMLRSCGRFDLVPPVYQLTVADLIALRGSPTVALVRPPGRILLEHRRTEVLASLRSKTQAAHDAQKARVPSASNVAAQAPGKSPAFVPKDWRLEEQ